MKSKAKEYRKKLCSCAENYNTLLEFCDKRRSSADTENEENAVHGDQTVDSVESIYNDLTKDCRDVDDHGDTSRPADSASGSIARHLIMAFWSCIWMDVHWMMADMSSDPEMEGDNVNKGYSAANSVQSKLKASVSSLMAKTSLLEVALDYFMPIAAYLTLIKAFGAQGNKFRSRKIDIDCRKHQRDFSSYDWNEACSVKKGRSESPSQLKYHQWDDGLSEIR